MPTRQSTDDKLIALETAADSADAESLLPVLVQGLKDRHYRVVALAAHFAADKLVYESVPMLLAAYPRFIEKPAKRDPNCYAKKAITRALYDLDCCDVEFYLAAIRYQQMEPTWGGSVDSAADLRVSAAMGLVASGYSRALAELAELLTDSEPPVRAGAARAIACGNPREAEQLLRLKIFAGDEEALVIADCFTGLLTVEPEESVQFVSRFLADGDDVIQEAAALALGESRLPAAIDSLKAAWQDVLVPAEFRRVLIRAAALHRSNEAFDWLLALVAEGDANIAAETVEILSIYRHNEKLGERLRQVLDKRVDQDAMTVFEKVWM